MNKLMTLLRENDVLILPGGSDIDPSIYGKKNFMSYTSEYSRMRDAAESELYEKAKAEGRPVFGICRGMQLASALNGLTLIQDVNHPHGHKIFVESLIKDYKDVLYKMYVNSIHHQLVWTENKLETDDFKVYGYCNISDVHEYQKDEEIECKIEPEIIYFPKTKTIGVQFHPELMSERDMYKPIINYLCDLVNETILK